jgi:hypothetical protein
MKHCSNIHFSKTRNSTKGNFLIFSLFQEGGEAVLPVIEMVLDGFHRHDAVRVEPTLDAPGAPS